MRAARLPEGHPLAATMTMRATHSALARAGATAAAGATTGGGGGRGGMSSRTSSLLASGGLG
jgi:hypothetical protein